MAASVQWRKLSAATEPPPPRAYHTLTRVSDRKLVLVGGFDGKTTFGDIWWLMTDGEKGMERNIHDHSDCLEVPKRLARKSDVALKGVEGL